MALVLGLGNPGATYARTRHNIGWRVLDVLATRWRAAPGESTIEYRCRTAAFRDRDVVLMEPLTNMNRSGEALAAWRERHGFELSDLLVVCDDVYLPLGALRLRVQGSSGGHRGLESLEEAVGMPDYARLRLGVGDAGGSERLKEHVLEEFEPSQDELLRRAVERAADAVECWLAEGPLATMNRFNRRAIEEESPS